MHAYLISGGTEKTRNEKAKQIAKSSTSQLVHYDIKKIDDVRELGKHTNLKINQKTVIVLPNIELASEESQNALLKSIEEPQKNLQFVLTANNELHVLPTIVSRCESIRLKTSKDQIDNAKLDEFFELSTGDQLNKVNSIKDRDKAIIFMKDSIAYLRMKLSTSDGKSLVSRRLRAASITYNNLTKNGNVNLQLANFVIQTKK